MLNSHLLEEAVLCHLEVTPQESKHLVIVIDQYQVKVKCRFVSVQIYFSRNLLCHVPRGASWHLGVII